MKTIFFSLVISFQFICAGVFSQTEDINSILDRTLSYRGLTRDDFTIPFDTADKVNTNQCSLILPVVYDLMKHPLNAMTYLDTVTRYKDLELNELVQTMFKAINYNGSYAPGSYAFSNDQSSLALLIAQKIKSSHEAESKLLSGFTAEEQDFLSRNLFSLFINSDQNAPENFDIYKLDEAQDSTNIISKRLLDILSKVDRKQIYENSISDFDFCYSLYKYIYSNKSAFESLQPITGNYEGITGDVLYYYNKDALKIVIGGKGRNTYTGKFDMIIDIGGDDAYYIDRDTTFTNNFNCIIDLSGSDYYTTNCKFALGSSVFSSGFIFDKEGDDTYKGVSVDIGAAICGIGLIYDESGSDIYSGNSFTIGAGCFGTGLIVDRNGNDMYIANTYGEGFGMTEGIGIVVDNKGNDTYTVNPQVLDIGRTNDHFLSMCQGFGFGLRPYYAGGIGIIVDGEGNDSYTADIFGQGCSYWYSLGIVIDSAGNDRYNCYHYAQGSGIHYSVGLFKDYEGWDYYNTNWVSQGCGHDYGFGFCWDVKGNDNYSCYGLSQGAGNANGIGLLIDESGRDGYLCKDNNCQGFGTPSREYGGIGILLDASGTDFYSRGGYDSLITNSSKWGILNDFYVDDLHPVLPEEEFKIDIEENRTYSRNDLYLFARTLEPRFSKWAAFGFNKLAEDSLNTSRFLLEKIGSDDIRDIVLIRNFVPRIGYTFGTVLAEKLNSYLNGITAMTVDEASFAIFLMGESHNTALKDILFKAAQSSVVRVRQAAINALGKTNYNDQAFNEKVSSRLREMAAENNPKKTYNKDIAFAFRNFKNEMNIESLINLMSNNYYGARFNAAEDLADYGDVYAAYLSDAVLNRIAADRIWFIAMLNSLGGLGNDKFTETVERIMKMSVAKDDAVNYSLTGVIQIKQTASNDKEFVKWCGLVIAKLSKSAKLRVTQLYR